MIKIRLTAILILIVGAGLGWYAYAGPAFRLGLDLSGGSQLVYEADVSALDPVDIANAMSTLREVIDRRINAFGVAEPLVQVEQVGFGDRAAHRLVIELPGVTDLEQALATIDKTPLLEFRLSQNDGGFGPAVLTGRYVERAQVNYSQAAPGPEVLLNFNDEGADIFAGITGEHVGEPLAIFLDGQLISVPVIQSKITGGEAVITGQFTLTEVRELVRNLNLGALPVPISLVSTETIGPSLGEETLTRGVRAGLWGLVAVAAFMVLWYRLGGLMAILALGFYLVLILVLFKLLGVTLTAAGIAGLILSFGLALDSNILIAERLKEEILAGRHIHDAIREGFARAWLSIRDANLASLISAIVLFWLGTSFIRGFALTLALGLIVSMFTAISISRVLLLAVAPASGGRVSKFLFKCGLN